MGITACGNTINLSFASSETPTIEEIKTEENLNQLVFVKGKITRIIPLAELNVYQIQDDTHSIWIVADSILGEINQPVEVEGVLKYQDILIDNQELGEFYLEMSRISNE